MNRLMILKGEGIHQHTLYGQFDTVETVTEYQEINVTGETVLKHEKPNGDFSNEHKGLQVEVATWVMGKQVEYNPFSGKITDIWD
jgi:SPX domain protein involved in polyphosphate accumulation